MYTSYFNQFLYIGSELTFRWLLITLTSLLSQDSVTKVVPRERMHLDHRRIRCLSLLFVFL